MVLQLHPEPQVTTSCSSFCCCDYSARPRRRYHYRTLSVCSFFDETSNVRGFMRLPYLLVKGFLWRKINTTMLFWSLPRTHQGLEIFQISVPRSSMKTKLDSLNIDSHATRWIENPQCLECCVSSFRDKCSVVVILHELDRRSIIMIHSKILFRMTPLIRLF